MGGRRHLPDIMGEALGRLSVSDPPPPPSRPVLVSVAAPEPQPELAMAQRLGNLGLKGMAQALLEETEADSFQAAMLPALENLLQREEELRHQRAQASRLRRARLPQQASLAKLEEPAQRGLDPESLEWLAGCSWVDQGRVLLLVGGVGAGKTFLASALARQACLNGHTALYARLPEVLSTLAFARMQGRWSKALAAYARPGLLVLDDLGLSPLKPEQTADLLELAEARHARRATLIASTLHDRDWPGLFPTGPAGLAMLDRWLPGAVRVELQGESRRA